MKPDKIGIYSIKYEKEWAVELGSDYAFPVLGVSSKSRIAAYDAAERKLESLLRQLRRKRGNLVTTPGKAR